MDSRVKSFVARQWCVPEASIGVKVQPLPGGLESSVGRARITHRDRRRLVPRRLVVKKLQSGFEREAGIYEVLWRHVNHPPAVRVLGSEVTEHATYLYLEDAKSISSWPWSDTGLATVVCRALARLHDGADLPRDAFSWDYEAALVRSAESTLDTANAARDTSGRRYWRRVGDLQRVVTALPAIRSRLLSADTTVIHGDVQPGNVILRRGVPHPRAAFIDWARARIGSPLEDIASWLHSLGCWEPEARRRHDTLMRAYLEARKVRRRFASDVRFDYWLASVSNGLSGAIRYHLAVLWDSTAAESARYDSGRALRAWERVVRRGAALLSTNLDRCT
jgi:aminoglycoside phosphotransferase (APT) family kinase protein